jgi:hypothetical protein
MDPKWSVCGIRSNELQMVHKHLQATCMARFESPATGASIRGAKGAL